MLYINMITEELNNTEKSDDINQITEYLLSGLTIRQISYMLYSDISDEHIDYIVNIQKGLKHNRKISKFKLYSSLAYEYEVQRKILNKVKESILEDHYNMRTDKIEDSNLMLYKLERLAKLSKSLHTDIIDLMKWSDEEPELVNIIKKVEKSNDIINIRI